MKPSGFVILKYTFIDPGSAVSMVTVRHNKVIGIAGTSREELTLFKREGKPFVRSGKVAITRSPIERLSEFLKKRDEMLKVLDK